MAFVLGKQPGGKVANGAIGIPQERPRVQTFLEEIEASDRSARPGRQRFGQAERPSIMLVFRDVSSMKAFAHEGRQIDPEGALTCHFRAALFSSAKRFFYS